MSKKIQVLLLTSSMLIIAFVMIGSLGVHASGASNSGDVTLKHIGVYSEVLYRVRAEYVEEPNMSTVTDGALHGLLESLDADSSYLTTSEYKVFEQKTEGKANNGGIAKSLRDCRANIGLAFCFLLLENLVFRWGEIAGVSVQRFQQTVQRAVCDRAHVGLFHIFRATR